MVGEVGEVREAIAPGAPGKVFVHGENLARGSNEALGRRRARARDRGATVWRLQVRSWIVTRLWQTDAKRRERRAQRGAKEKRDGGRSRNSNLHRRAFSLLSGLKVLNEYERAVVFRLGRLTPYRGPGVIFVIPILERDGADRSARP